MKIETLVPFLFCLLSPLAVLAAEPTSKAPAVVESDYPEVGMIPNTNMDHIGIIVRDIDAAIKHWTAFLGVDELPKINIASGHEDNPTHFKGHPSDAKAKLAFIQLENLQVELIEPLEDDPSHWKEFLDTKGEGVHHIAFWVKGMGEQYLDKYAELGMPVEQHGGWDGGEYGYMGSREELAVTVELLENYKKASP